MLLALDIDLPFANRNSKKSLHLECFAQRLLNLHQLWGLKMDQLATLDTFIGQDRLKRVPICIENARNVASQIPRLTSNGFFANPTDAPGVDSHVL